MIKLKRAFSLVIIFAMTLSLMAGCGQTTTQESAVSETAASVSATADAAVSEAPREPSSPPETDDASENNMSVLPITEELTTITMWTGMAPFAAQYISDLNELSVFKEMEARTNIHVDFTIVSPEAEREQFQLMIAAGEYTDLIGAGASLYIGGQDKAVSDGIYVDMLPLLKEYGPNYYDIIYSDEELTKTILTDEGNVVAFYNVYAAPLGATQGALIRGDWLDELGLDVPQTYTELHDALTAMKTEYGATMFLAPNGVANNNNLIAGYNISGAFEVGFMTSYPFFQKDGEVKFGFIEPEFKDYMTMVSTWYSEGIIDPDFMSNSDGNINRSHNLILSGRNSMAYGAMVDIDSITLESEGKIQMVPMPETRKEQGDNLHVTTAPTLVNNSTWVITTDCKIPETVVKWADYFYSDEGSLLCNYGVLGEGLVYVDGKPALSELITNNPDGLTPNIATYIYAMSNANGTPFVFDMTKEYAGYSDIQMSALDVWNNELDDGLYNIPGGVSLNEAESTELALKMGDIATYASENLVAFITGNKPMSEFDAFVEGLKGMGIYDCIALYQQAYDRYLTK